MGNKNLHLTVVHTLRITVVKANPEPAPPVLTSKFGAPLTIRLQDTEDDRGCPVLLEFWASCREGSGCSSNNHFNIEDSCINVDVVVA